MPVVGEGRGYWSRVVAEYEALGGAHAGFCEARGLNLATFRTWLYRLRREGLGAEPGFLEVVGAEARVGGEVCVVRLGEVEVGFRTLPEAEYLAALVLGLDDVER